MEVEITSYNDLGRCDRDLLKKGGEFIDEDGWGEFIFSGGRGTVDCDKTGGGIGTGHEDVNEFKGPEKCVIDAFGFDGGLEEDTHPITSYTFVVTLRVKISIVFGSTVLMF